MRNLSKTILTLTLFLSLFILPAKKSSAQDQIPDIYICPIDNCETLPEYTTSTKTTYDFKFTRSEIHLRYWANGDVTFFFNIKLKNLVDTPITNVTNGFRFDSNDLVEIHAWNDDDRNLETQLTYDSVTGWSHVTIIFPRPIEKDEEFVYKLKLRIIGAFNYYDGMLLSTYVEANYDSFVDYSEIHHIVPGNTIPVSYYDNNYTEEGNHYIWKNYNVTETTLINTGVKYYFRDIIVMEHFHQLEESWSPEIYGTLTNYRTIAEWGCNLTSNVMMLNYWAFVKDETLMRTDPKELNDYLKIKENHGYIGDLVYHPAVGNYARNNMNIDIANSFAVPQISINMEFLKTLIRSGVPVMVHTNTFNDIEYPGYDHYVIASGIIKEDNVEKISILDPAFRYTDNIFLSDTISGDDINEMRYFLGEPDYKTNILFSLHSPADVIVTNPDGLRTGHNPITDSYYYEIPGASFTNSTIASIFGGVENQVIRSESVEISEFYVKEGNYKVDLVGTGDGEYHLFFSTTNWNGDTTSKTYVGYITEGQIITYELIYDTRIGLVDSQIYLPLIRR